ncbi:MAG: monovalent cation/H+ antiporter subunit D family protein [Firmicutes bacterium]|nr:monovalent cation/H+ antiporter subunit D family protein [Bacillota bacterium]
MTASLIVPLVVVLPLVSALFVFLLRKRHPASSGVLALVTTGVVFILAGRLAALAGQAEVVVFQLEGLSLAVDRIAALLLLVFAGVSFTVLLFAQGLLGLEIAPRIVPRYYGVFLVLLASLMAVTVSDDLFSMYIFLEVVMVCAAVLVAAKGDKDSTQAAVRYLILNMVGSGVLLMGIAGLYVGTGHLQLSRVAEALPQAVSSYSLDILASIAMIMVGTAVKSALFPLHSWLPDAHGSAATPSSVVISGLLVKVNIVFLLKLLTQALPIDFAAQLPLKPILLVMSSAAILGGSLLALKQTDIKRMLAYSTAAQVGYIFLGVGLMNENSLTGSVFHILNHAVVKGMLVLAAGSIMKLTGRRRIADFAGVGRRFPLPMVVFTIGALSMVGVPPLSGFTSKWYLALGALAEGRAVLVGVLLLSSLLNAAYYLPIAIAAFFRSGKDIEQHIELTTGAKVSMLVLAVACVLIGLFSNVTVDFVQPAVHRLFLGGGA